MPDPESNQTPETASARLAFFVQNNYVERLTIPVACYAHQHGLALEDRSSSTEFDADHCGIDWQQYDCVIPYGSVQFLQKLKESILARFVLHDEARFATSACSVEFGKDALNAGGRRVLAADIHALLEKQEYLHLRPDSVDKAFTGGIHTSESWCALRSERDLSDDLSCWASPLRRIHGEWRCWIVGGEVIETS